jgi:hypothetical protein
VITTSDVDRYPEQDYVTVTCISSSVNSVVFFGRPSKNKEQYDECTKKTIASSMVIDADHPKRVISLIDPTAVNGQNSVRLQKRIQFLEEPRHEVYGTVAVFKDRFGNKWDLLQPKE